MQILQFQKKGPQLNTIERFQIHNEAAAKNHLNDEHTVTPNRIFDAILNKTTSPNPFYFFYFTPIPIQSPNSNL
jgi:hypothetical protein